jgi:hypothetical protein
LGLPDADGMDVLNELRRGSAAKIRRSSLPRAMSWKTG